MLIILFGLSASGKNFVGKTVSQHFHFHFWDADEAMPDDLKKSIESKIVFTQEMRDRFTEIIILKTQELLKKYPNLIIAQAFYKEKNRKQVAQHFPDARFILIDALPENIQARLIKRHDWIDEEYANKIRQNFEAPSLPHNVIHNNAGEISIINQIGNILK